MKDALLGDVLNVDARNGLLDDALVGDAKKSFS
jgi:hypothetical protein